MLTLSLILLSAAVILSDLAIHLAAVVARGLACKVDSVVKAVVKIRNNVRPSADKERIPLMISGLSGNVGCLV
jgi:hypothetical protein